MKSILKRVIKLIIRLFFKKPYQFLKRNSKQALIAYLLGVSPSTYMMTALTTQYQITQPKQIIEVISNSGALNILSGGFFKPTEGSLKQLTGSAIKSVGELTHSEDMINKGKNMTLSAKSWFDQGSSQVKSSIDNMIKDIKTSKNVTDEFVFSDYPNYYEITGLSKIDESTFPEKGQIVYSELDDLSRTQIARATLTYSNVENSLGKRGNFKANDKPSGWVDQQKGQEVDIPWMYGKSYHGYFYNRSHLIADQLGGEAIRRNAITGTRTQNVGGTDQKGGMRYSEIKATNWLKNNKDGILYYSAEPIYHESELVPRFVIVKMKSSDGSIDEEVKVYNTANGWNINYQTGEYSLK